MIAVEQVAALPGAVALAPAQVWIAAIILAALAGVIAVRLIRERQSRGKAGRDHPGDRLLSGRLPGRVNSCEPEQAGENPGRNNLPKENRPGRSREHLP